VERGGIRDGGVKLVARDGSANGGSHQREPVVGAIDGDVVIGVRNGRKLGTGRLQGEDFGVGIIGFEPVNNFSADRFRRGVTDDKEVDVLGRE